MQLAVILLFATAPLLPLPPAGLDRGPDLPPPEAAPPPAVETGECRADQGGVIDAQLGMQGTGGTQEACLPGGVGEPGNLRGFALLLEGCMAGCLRQVRIGFRIADAGDTYHYVLWRDAGGRPNDACGLAAFEAPWRQLAADGPLEETIELDGETVLVEEGERLYHGVLYAQLADPPDWYIGRQAVAGLAGMAYVNLSGGHGAWVDLDEFGFGSRWDVAHVITSACGATPVMARTWGAVKALYR